MDATRHDATDDAATLVTQHDATRQDATRCDATQAKAKRSLYNKTYYAKKKMRAAGLITTCRPAVTITPTTMSATASAAITSAAAAAATSFTASSASPPWKYGPDGTKRGPNASKMAKHRKLKPAVDKILNAGGVESQAAVLRAVADHPALTVARLLAGIDSSKSTNATKFLCEQSSRMLSRMRSTTGGKSTNE